MGFTYGCEMEKPGPYGYRLITVDENDVKNYTNEIYTYKGSVKLGNDRFEKQTDTPYKEGALKYLLALGNFAFSMISMVISFFV